MVGTRPAWCAVLSVVEDSSDRSICGRVQSGNVFDCESDLNITSGESALKRHFHADAQKNRERETAILDMNHQCKSPVNGSLSRSFRHQWNYTHMHTHTHAYTHMDDLHVECWRDTVWHHTGSFPPTDRWMRLIS